MVDILIDIYMSSIAYRHLTLKFVLQDQPLTPKIPERVYFWQLVKLLLTTTLEQVFMSADIMSSLCGIGVRVNNFSSKTTRPRDMLFFMSADLSVS